MPDIGEHGFCSERIFVPPSFPSIMKGYCKAAIRTQPYDLLRWSAAYFRCLANGENPPAKERLEFPVAGALPGLTPGYLKVLINQIGKNPNLEINTEEITQRWSALCLPKNDLDPIFTLLGQDSFPWVRFVAIAAGTISSSLSQTMILVCELFSDDPAGGRAAIPVGLFLDLYPFLAGLNCGMDQQSNNSENKFIFPGIGLRFSEDKVQPVCDFMKVWASKQDNMVMPRNIRHWMCPALDDSYLA